MHWKPRGYVTFLKPRLNNYQELMICNPPCNGTCSELELKCSAGHSAMSPAASVNNAPKLKLCKPPIIVHEPHTLVTQLAEADDLQRDALQTLVEVHSKDDTL